MKFDYKKTGIVAALVICVILMIYIGPVDGFRHGHYFEEYSYSEIPEDRWYDQVSLESGPYEIGFSPVKDYFDGVSILLFGQPEGNTGELRLSVYDSTGKQVDSATVDLEKPVAGVWYKTYLHSYLKKGENYKLQISTDNCSYFPLLQNVDGEYLPDEVTSGNALIAFAYAKSTFSFQEKVMIISLLIAVCIALAGVLIGKRKVFDAIAFGVGLTILLAWNYTHNSMDTESDFFDGFQFDSETLATASVITRQGDYYLNKDIPGYGLGRYYDLKGGIRNYDRTYTTDDNWNDGYSRTDARLLVYNDMYAQEVAVAGNIIGFANGDEYTISGVESDGSSTYIYLNTDKILSPKVNGSLDDATFYDPDHNQLPVGKIKVYESQYGLQGKVYKHLAKIMKPENRLENLHLMCSILAAIVFVLITFAVAAKYNKVLAGCFYITFWLSPWIVSYARNAYWVEFTWFIPMLVGLICALKIDNAKYRWGSYIAALASICIKSLCGYEFISVVMMGLITFLLADAVLALSEKNKDKALLIIRTIVIIGIMALVGFMLAIVIHANIKGNGDILAGIKVIIDKDVLRRTSGADQNEFTPEYWPSFNASVWETFSMYFKYRSQVITGVPGNLFPLLCIVPLCIFTVDHKNHKLHVELLTLYVVTFLGSISWFCLAKGHSYFHTHINFVLWYFGFVQMCFYIIVNKLVSLYNNMTRK